jgi:hypothetical protein
MKDRPRRDWVCVLAMRPNCGMKISAKRKISKTK